MNGRIGHILRTGGFGIALAAMLLGGCSEDGGPAGSRGDAIGFRTNVETTRATETTADNIRSFRVSAVWDKTGGSYDPAFMERQIVEKENKEWVYSPTVYMPAKGSVDFFAYSPAISSGVQSFDMKEDDPAVNGYSAVIGYTAPTDPLAQEDFMVAVAAGQTANSVRLDFGHILSSAGFEVRGATEAYRVHSITLSGLYTEGTLTGTIAGSPETVDWNWDDLSSPGDYAVYQTVPVDVDHQTPVPFNGGIGPLMILPQTAGNGGAEIRILFDTPDRAVPRYTYTVPLWDIYDSDFVFAPGTNYTFSVTLDTAKATTRSGRPASASKVEVAARKM